MNSAEPQPIRGSLEPDDKWKSSYVNPSSTNINHVLERNEEVLIVNMRGYDSKEVYIVIKGHPGDKYELKRASDNKIAPDLIDRANIQRNV